ncbi:MAG: RedB protein, partial [Candidatus Polarisedimenticolia bacterium]
VEAGAPRVPPAVLAATVSWLLVVGAGMGILVDDAARPGEADEPPPSWPVASGVRRTPGRPVVVMLVHPRCPCSRASLEELARIAARAPGRGDLAVLFLKPAGAPESWWRSDEWGAAEAIPATQVVADEDGREAARFGARTSGHTLFYDGGGLLRFSGGITGARGHAGDNAGQAALLALLGGGRPARDRTPVFGCALRDPAGGKEDA